MWFVFRPGSQDRGTSIERIRLGFASKRVPGAAGAPDRLDEKQAVTRLAHSVMNGERFRFAWRDGGIKLDLERAVSRSEGGVLDVRNFEIDGIERQVRDRFVECANRYGADPFERFIGKVRRQVEVDMLDGSDLIGTVSRTRAGQRKSLMFV